MFCAGHLLWSTPYMIQLIEQCCLSQSMWRAGHSLQSTSHFVCTSSHPGYHLVLVFLLFWWSSHLVQWGYKAAFLPVARVPLHAGGSTPHQGGRHQLVHPPDMEGYLPLLVLQNCDSVPWELCWSWGSPSDGIYRQGHHSLSQTYVFLLMPTPTAHYLVSSPIFSGCSSGHPW